MKRNSFAPSLWGRRALSALLALALCLGLLPGAVFAGETPETGGQTPKILASRTLREAFAEEEDKTPKPFNSHLSLTITAGDVEKTIDANGGYTALDLAIPAGTEVTAVMSFRTSSPVLRWNLYPGSTFDGENYTLGTKETKDTGWDGKSSIKPTLTFTFTMPETDVILEPEMLTGAVPVTPYYEAEDRALENSGSCRYDWEYILPTALAAGIRAPQEGQRFAGWYALRDPAKTVYQPKDKVSLTYALLDCTGAELRFPMGAKWEEDTNLHTLTVDPSGGRYTVVCSDSGACLVPGTAEDAYAIPAGSTVTLTFTPRGNETLDHWTLNGESLSGDRFTMPEGDAEVKAVLKAEPDGTDPAQPANYRLEYSAGDGKLYKIYSDGTRTPYTGQTNCWTALDSDGDGRYETLRLSGFVFHYQFAGKYGEPAFTLKDGTLEILGENTLSFDAGDGFLTSGAVKTAKVTVTGTGILRVSQTGSNRLWRAEQGLNITGSPTLILRAAAETGSDSEACALEVSGGLDLSAESRLELSAVKGDGTPGAAIRLTNGYLTAHGSAAEGCAEAFISGVTGAVGETGNRTNAAVLTPASASAPVILRARTEAERTAKNAPYTWATGQLGETLFDDVSTHGKLTFTVGAQSETLEQIRMKAPTALALRAGDVVTVSAEPAEGYTLTGWTLVMGDTYRDYASAEKYTVSTGGDLCFAMPDRTVYGIVAHFAMNDQVRVAVYAQTGVANDGICYLGYGKMDQPFALPTALEAGLLSGEYDPQRFSHWYLGTDTDTQYHPGDRITLTRGWLGTNSQGELGFLVHAKTADDRSRLSLTTAVSGQGILRFTCPDESVMGRSMRNLWAVPKGTVITLIPEPAEGWQFKEWQSAQAAIANNTFSMPGSDAVVTAVFEPIPANQYEITLLTTEGGAALASAVRAEEGEEITLTAAPQAGYAFQKWEVVSGKVTVENDRFTMPAGPVTLRAVFLEKTAAPVISPAGKAFFPGFEPTGTLSCETEGAWIEYTVNGAQFHYREPFQITETSVVTAWATKMGKADSDPVTVLFTLQDADKGIKIDEITFPDAAFREGLTQKLDIRPTDGYISSIEQVTTLYVDSLNITSLAGVQALNFLHELNCCSNLLETVDLSQNTSLRALDLSNNCLTSLDLSKNTLLDASQVNLTGNRYTLVIGAGQRRFALSALPGAFDPAKASHWTNAAEKDGILTVTDLSQPVTYVYDCGRGFTMTVTLTVTQHSHSYALSPWQSDDAGHWKLCSDADCPLPDKGATQKEAHSYGDDARCALCGHKDGTSYQALIQVRGDGTASAKPSWAPAGTEITLTAVPGESALFQGWQVVRGNVTIENDRFILPRGGAEILAVFVPGDIRVDMSPAEPYTFAPLTFGYESVDNLNITLTNTGNVATGTLQVRFEGDAAFAAVTESLFRLPSIPAGGTANLSVYPQSGLGVGTHTGTLTLARQADGQVLGTLSLTVTVVPAAGHVHDLTGPWLTDSEHHWKQCAECSEIALRAPHSFRWVIDREATRTETGLRHEECAECALRRKENTVIPKLPAGEPITPVGPAKPSEPVTPVEPVDPVDPAEPTDPAQPGFSDVGENDWFAPAVRWAADSGITGGVGSGRFGAELPCTRAQAVTFLWRAAGSPAPEQAADFTDVPENAYYAPAVAWALETGITTGTGDTQFSPDQPCTRVQVVLFLWRAAGSPEPEQAANFADVPDDAYYAQAVAWAVETGITSGTGESTFSPDRPCTRGEIVTFLHRALVK